MASAVSVFGLLLGVASSVAVGVALWQRDRAAAPDRAASLAFDVVDFGTAQVSKLTLPPDRLALVIESNNDSTIADVRASDAAINAAVNTAAADEASGDHVSFDRQQIGSKLWSFAALRCSDEEGCSAIVAGVASSSFWEFGLARWYWGAASTLLIALASFVAARWLVGRSLRPIEMMRIELESITATHLDHRVSVTNGRDEVERLGSTVNATLDRLEQAVGANERFVADAAHELRSPLTGVRLALELEGTNASRPLLDDALQEVDRAIDLIDDLLTMAKRPSTRSIRTSVDLNELLAEEIGAFRLRFPNVTVIVDANVSPQSTTELGPVMVTVDREGVRRVVRNIFDNAAFYGRDRVQTGLATNATTTTISIDDNGPGIAVGDRIRVFDRFTRLDSSRARETGGTGLGLAIAMEIVHDHGGRIDVGEAPLGGARFAVTLPRV